MKASLIFYCTILLFTVCNKAQISSQENHFIPSQQVSTRDEPLKELNIDDLEMIISEAEKQGNVSARSHIHQYWQLADLYIINEDYKNAYNVIIKGLRLDSWNYKYQKIASEIEIINQEYERAYNRLNFIINNLSELGNIFNESTQQIKSINLDNIQRSPVNLPGYYVYIATYPNLFFDVINVLAARISEEYGIEVKIINIGLKESEVNVRDRQTDTYDEIIKDVYLRYSKESVDNFLDQIGLTNDEMNTREGKRRFVYSLLNQTDQGRNRWEEIDMISGQYSGNALLEQLSQRFRNYRNDPYCLGILGVTSNDIYENDYNFLFGWTREGLGIMSYARFLLGSPTSEQFEKRTIMQAFSSIGFIIGIPRCTNPNCARAYPNSLDEQDRKEEMICNECKDNLRNKYLSFIE